MGDNSTTYISHHISLSVSLYIRFEGWLAPNVPFFGFLSLFFQQSQEPKAVMTVKSSFEASWLGADWRQVAGVVAVGS